MFKVNNKDTRTTPSVSIVNFEHAIANWDPSSSGLTSRINSPIF